MRGGLVVVVVVLALGAVGCGGSPDGTGGDLDGDVTEPDGHIHLPDAGPPLTFETFADALARAHCAQYFSCCSAAELDDVFDGDPPADEAECVTIARVAFDADLSAVAKLIAAGDIVFDATAAAACVESFGGVGCSAFSDEYYAPSCLAAFVGQLDVGEACSFGPECATQLYCDDGTCAARAGVTESCKTASCQRGLYCDAGSVCRPALPNGSKCDSNDQCAGCECDSLGSGACGPPSPTCGQGAG